MFVNFPWEWLAGFGNLVALPLRQSQFPGLDRVVLFTNIAVLRFQNFLLNRDTVNFASVKRARTKFIKLDSDKIQGF